MKNPSILLLFIVLSAAAFGQRNPNVDNALTRVALNMREGNYPSAIASYNVLIAEDPKNESEYWYEKGICYYRMHADSASRESFREGLQKKNLYAGNNFGMGLNMIRSNPDSALIYFRKTVSLLKDSLQQNNLNTNYIGRRQILADAYHNIGLIFLEKKQNDSAQQYLFKSIDLDPATDEHLLAASYFFHRNKDFTKSASYARLALQMNRYESRSALLQALSLEKEGKLTKAIAMHKELIMAQEVALSSWRRGGGALKEDLMSSYQVKGYKQMQEINAEFYVILAYLHFRKNEKDLSAEAYKRAVKANPDVFYNISNEASFTAFVEEFIKSKLRLPVAPKDYLPVYRNLFLIDGKNEVRMFR